MGFDLKGPSSECSQREKAKDTDRLSAMLEMSVCMCVYVCVSVSVCVCLCVNVCVIECI